MNYLLPSTIAAVLVTGLSAYAGIQPAAVYSPSGARDVEILSSEDGRWEVVSTQGRRAVRNVAGGQPASNYLYFRLSDGARSRLKGDAYIVLDYFNEAPGVVNSQYNTADNAYADGAGLLLAGSGKWERALITMKDADFRGVQNAGADFRLHTPSRIAVSRLEVYAADPGLKLPDSRERARKALRTSMKPRGMYYTFGGDVTETSAPLFRTLGVTSVESYVTWESVERRGEGQWDWSRWDNEVRILKEHGLKWVPFLILGPAYSTPAWFRDGKDHYGCICLEHGIQSKVESLWNPALPKWIDRFLAAFAERYGGSGVIESVLLGIQGDFGEAIYSVWGGGWTFDIPGEYHNHAGFWCDDPFALASFRKYLETRYSSVAALNTAWGTPYRAVAEADFPGRKDELTSFRERLASGDAATRRRWLDFVDWYRASMTDWSDWWMGTARKHFPQTPIYLCTGGDAPPEHGSNFAEQCRVAAKHRAGVRITNEASDYAANFAVTRWVASAGKHYGAYFGFEPAGAEDEKGIAARIYNATASGANQLHDYHPNVISSPSRIQAQRKSIGMLFHVSEPVVPVALWYPNVALTLKWGGFLEKAAALRDFTDFDYVDESMLRTGALGRHKVLIIVHGDVMEPGDARLIADWIRKGGQAIVLGVSRFESVAGTAVPERTLFGSTPAGRSLGNGAIARAGSWDELASSLTAVMDAAGILRGELKKDGVFWTQIAKERFLVLDTNREGTIIESRGSVRSPSDR